jgi:hypothetical protein
VEKSTDWIWIRFSDITDRMKYHAKNTRSSVANIYELEKKPKNIRENQENVWIHITAKINWKKAEKEQADPDGDLEQPSHGPSMASSSAPAASTDGDAAAPAASTDVDAAAPLTTTTINPTPVRCL